MSADFTTTISVKGTKGECLEIMKVLCYYANDRKKQYRENHDCWYLDESLGTPEEEVEQRWENGEMKLVISGPYGVWNPIDEDCDLFERIADAVPTCYFFGSISGWDSGGDLSLEAELKDELLYLRSSYRAFGYDDEEFDDEFDDDEFDDEFDDEYDDEMDEDESGESTWDTVYDPKTKSYSQVSSASEGDSVVVTISILDKNRIKHELSLPSDTIEYPINFNCYPEDFLSDSSVENLFSILLDTIEGDGFEDRKKDIEEFRIKIESELMNNGLSKLELIKIHDHKAPFFFGWLRANVTYPEMKKLAKKVCTCAEKNKQKNIDAFENYLNTFKPWFPACEYPGWPEFCYYHIVDEGNGRRSCTGNPNYQGSVKLDWSCVADSVEDFAKLICSKENPREYAVERVLVDFEAGTTEQSAVYMPGGPHN